MTNAHVPYCRERNTKVKQTMPNVFKLPDPTDGCWVPSLSVDCINEISFYGLIKPVSKPLSDGYIKRSDRLLHMKETNIDQSELRIGYFRDNI